MSPLHLLSSRTFTLPSRPEAGQFLRKAVKDRIRQCEDKLHRPKAGRREQRKLRRTARLLPPITTAAAIRVHLCSCEDHVAADARARAGGTGTSAALCGVIVQLNCACRAGGGRPPMLITTRTCKDRVRQRKWLALPSS